MPHAAGQRSTSPFTPRRDRTGLTLPQAVQAVQAAAGSAPPAQELGLTIARVSSWISGRRACTLDALSNCLVGYAVPVGLGIHRVARRSISTRPTSTTTATAVTTKRAA